MVKFSHTYTGGAPLKATKTLGVGIIALATPLLVLATTMPAAQASDVTASLNLTNQCVWTFGTESASIALASDSGANYTGAALTINNSVDANPIGLSIGLGSSIDGDIARQVPGDTTACSFFNVIQSKKVTATLGAAVKFAAVNNASQAETGMDFSIASGNPLTVKTDPGTNCNMSYFTNSGEDFAASPAALSITATLGSVDALQNHSVAASGAVPIPNFLAARDTAHGDAGVNDSTYKVQCLPTITISTTIPLGMTPDEPGTTYSFSGPEIVFAMAPLVG